MGEDTITTRSCNVRRVRGQSNVTISDLRKLIRWRVFRVLHITGVTDSIQRIWPSVHVIVCVVLMNVSICVGVIGAMFVGLILRGIGPTQSIVAL